MAAESGFVAGTLVHTKTGLLPIENVKVGDFVLSRRQKGGEQSFQRVLRTILHKDEPVFRFDYSIDEPGKGRMDFFYLTANQLFWERTQGWVKAKELKNGGILERADGTILWMEDYMPIYKTRDPNVGLFRLFGDQWYGVHNLNGRLKILLEVDPDVESDVELAFSAAVESFVDGKSSESPEKLYFRVPVYNLEIKDDHTYYVGETGILVHSSYGNTALQETASTA